MISEESKLKNQLRKLEEEERDLERRKAELTTQGPAEKSVNGLNNTKAREAEAVVGEPGVLEEFRKLGQSEAALERRRCHGPNFVIIHLCSHFQTTPIAYTTVFYITSHIPLTLTNVKLPA